MEKQYELIGTVFTECLKTGDYWFNPYTNKKTTVHKIEKDKAHPNILILTYLIKGEKKKQYPAGVGESWPKIYRKRKIRIG